MVMEPFTVDASTLASRCAGSSAVSDPLIVLAVTPPVSPNASMRTRTSPFTSSTLTGPRAVTTSTSPLTAWTTRGPRAPATCTSPTVVVASRPALRGSRTVKSTATSLWRPPRIRMSWWPGPQSLSLPHIAHTATPPSTGTATRRTLALSEERYVFTAEICNESPLDGSTVTEPRVFRIHSHWFAPSLARYVHGAPARRPGPPSSRANSLRKSRRAIGRSWTTPVRTRPTA